MTDTHHGDNPPIDWYIQLNQYFPVEEMKHRAHIESLLTTNPHYKLEYCQEYVLLYVEHDEFLFIDYIYVCPTVRGTGKGSSILTDLCNRGKNVIVELERETSCEIILRRIKFYERLGFQRAENIAYERTHVVTGLPLNMDIYFFIANQQPQDKQTNQEQELNVLHQMHWVYSHIHSHRAIDWYGAHYEPVDEILYWK